jgi:UDP-2,4-diacetamido-2,4,6-trideoxy-beta-L-altropyranose hydrolase
LAIGRVKIPIAILKKINVMTRKRVILRADGNSYIGLGHVIRCLSLVEILQLEYDCAFAIREPDTSLLAQIKAICSDVIILPLCSSDEASLFFEEIELFWERADLVVLDGYGFDTMYQAILKEKGVVTVCVDDTHATHFVADAVLNHGLPDRKLYSVEPYTKVYLGPKYSLLRRPFRESASKPRSLSKGNVVFLCFGGADPMNLTTRYLGYLMAMPIWDRIHVVTGSAFQHIDDLNGLLNNTDKVKWHRNISAQALAELIVASKVAIVPGSTIALECAAVGIGLLCGYYVQNQVHIAHALCSKKMAHALLDMNKIGFEELFVAVEEMLIPNKLEQILNTQREHFDMQLESRILTIFKELI